MLDEEALKQRGKTHEHQRRMDERQRQRKEHLREVPRGRRCQIQQGLPRRQQQHHHQQQQQQQQQQSPHIEGVYLLDRNSIC